MAATPPSNPKSSGDDRNSGAQAPVPLTFEDNLNAFWQKNRTVVIALFVVVILAIVGKDVWERIQAGKERDIETAFQEAKTPEQLRAFVSAHPDHLLAGIAELQIADDEYTSGKLTEAAADYDRAASLIKSGPLAARAELGRGLTKIQSGKASEGAADLKLLANDTAQLKTFRAEAAYQLASLSAEQGNAADVQKYFEQIQQIEPQSMWARRAMMLIATMPKPAGASGMSVPAVSAPAAKDTASPSVRINVPTK